MVLERTRLRNKARPLRLENLPDRLVPLRKRKATILEPIVRIRKRFELRTWREQGPRTKRNWFSTCPFSTPKPECRPSDPRDGGCTAEGTARSMPGPCPSEPCRPPSACCRGCPARTTRRKTRTPSRGRRKPSPGSPEVAPGRRTSGCGKDGHAQPPTEPPCPREPRSRGSSRTDASPPDRSSAEHAPSPETQPPDPSPGAPHGAVQRRSRPCSRTRPSKRANLAAAEKRGRHKKETRTDD